MSGSWGANVCGVTNERYLIKEGGVDSGLKEEGRGDGGEEKVGEGGGGGVDVGEEKQFCFVANLLSFLMAVVSRPLWLSLLSLTVLVETDSRGTEREREREREREGGGV